MGRSTRVRLPAAGGWRELAPVEALGLALALHRAGRLAEADQVYAAIEEALPAHFDALHLRGVLRHQQGRNEEAAALIVRALESAPDSADALSNLGAVYRGLGRLKDAAGALRRAIELAPALAQAHNNLGSVLQALGRTDEAEAAYREAVRLDAGFVDARSNLANVLLERGEHEAALRACGEVLAVAPGHAGALANLGNALRALGRTEQAREALQRAIESEPDRADAHYNLGLVLDDGGDRRGALEAYRRALALDPAHGPALSGALVTQRALGDWEGLDTLRARCFAALAADVQGLSPFALLLEDSAPAQQLHCARLWGRQRQAACSAAPFAFRRRNSRRIRIGYLSADFYRHPTAWLIAGMIEAHDRGRFRVRAYSSGPDDSSPIRRRLVKAFDAFRDVRGQSPAAIAQQIYADGTDILIDLKGYTLDALTEVVALRPAPIQVSYLGYPGTMGVDYVDYLIADEVVIPQGAEQFYTEKIVRLPGSYQVNDRQRAVAADTPSRGACGLPARGFVFCCFNAPQKISPEMFTLWMSILRETPGAVLWLLDLHPAHGLSGRLRREAAGCGIAEERVVFAGRLPLEEHLARYRIADLFLDTRPYNAHTTASDALWAGCPVLTCPGDTFASRVAASLLRAAGLPELIAGSLDEYRARAVAFGTGAAGDDLVRLRERLALTRLDCPLFDTGAFTRHVEAAYRRMHELRMRGEPPESLQIE